MKKTVKKFRKKPVEVYAIEYDDNEAQILKWIASCQTTQLSKNPKKVAKYENGQLKLKTLESGDGWFVVSPSDWVIRGVQNEFYACKPDIFKQTYEAVD